jgi:nitric oxide reductase subunit C
LTKVKGNRLILGILVCLVTTYNVILYTQNTDRSNAPFMSKEAIKGEHLWQQNNCTACHQLYGLGGYLGPDLTNIASNPNKGREYAKAFFNSGVKSMPQFNFTEEEKESIACFLEHVDKTGIYPNKNAEFDYSGWVTLEYK